MANTKECYKNCLRLKTPALIRILRRNEISVFSWNNPLYASDERSFCSSKKIMKVSEKTRGLQNFFFTVASTKLGRRFWFSYRDWRWTCKPDSFFPVTNDMFKFYRKGALFLLFSWWNSFLKIFSADILLVQSHDQLNVIHLITGV